MNAATQSNVLKWAQYSDFDSARARHWFTLLRNVHDSFTAIQPKLRDKTYEWPLRPLFAWSRRIEYPFAMEHLSTVMPQRILDAGSGVTFLPFAYQDAFNSSVTCFDFDENYPSRMDEAATLLKKDRVDFVVGDLTKELPFQTGAFDGVTCISVLEHLPVQSRANAIKELWRCVKKGGRLVITLDIVLGKKGEGVPLAQLSDFLSIALDQMVLINESRPSELPKDAITTHSPGYGKFPIEVQLGNSYCLIENPTIGWFLEKAKIRVPYLPDLACFMIALTK